MLIFVWSSSVIKPISILVVVIPVLEPIPLVVPCVLLVQSSLLLSLLKLCLFWLFLLLPDYPLLFLKFGLDLYDELYELFLLEDLSKDPLKDLSADLFVDLVLIAFMSQS